MSRPAADGNPVPPPFAARVDSLVLQHSEPAHPAAERIGTEDLDWREVRDALWLARSLRPPGETPMPPEPPPEPPVAGTTAEPEYPAEEPGEPGETDGAESRAATDAQDGGPGVAARKWQNWTVGAPKRARAVEAEAGMAEQTAPLAWPTVPDLPDSRLIARSLRPFNKTSPSPWRQVLDEEGTADRAAQDRMWIPQWRPAPWHRFEVVLVVDTSASMEIWRHTVSEFRAVLERQGAFRNVRTCVLDCDQPDDDKLVLRCEGPSGMTRNWRDLVDTTGRRIVLVLTDAVGPAWRAGAATRLTAKWAKVMPVALVHMLPQRLWHWGALSPHRLRLSAAAPGVANAELRVETPHRLPLADPGNGVVVPVLGLAPEWLSSWAGLVTGLRMGRVELTAVRVRPDHDLEAESAELDEKLPEPDTPRGRVLRFRTIASVQAFQLAGLLAAAPLNMPMMQLVQRVLLPGSSLATLAEVLLGGLLRRTERRAAADDSTAVAYEFHDGVREELLARERRDNTVRVARIISEHSGRASAVLRNFRDALGDPDSTDLPEVSEENLPHLRVQEAVFRALSGRYSKRGQRLRRRIVQADPKAGVIHATVGASGASESVQKSVQPTGRPSPGVPDSAEDFSLTATELPSTPGVEHAPGSSGGDEVSTPVSPLSVEVRRSGASQPQIWGAIPLRNPDFVGREDLLERLRDRLQTPGTTAVLPEALHGMGGVGKSQTVVEYIYQHAGEYDVIWWIPAEHSAQIRSSFVELAKKIGVSAAGSAETAVPAVLEALRKGEPFSRWLLVFDNADRPEAVSQFFPAGSGHIVVTSRNSQWAGVARTVEVDLFTREESKELLRRRGGEISDEDADQLASVLGDLPLAIEQAASWRAQTGMPTDEYVQLLEQNRTELLETGAPSDYRLPVAAAWNVPLSRLRAEHPAALELLQLCAFFGPEPISRSLFTGVRDAPVPDALNEAFRDPIKLNRAVREISRYSLAKIDYRTNTFQLHRLVQAVLKNQLSDEDQDRMRHAVHILLVNGDPGDPEATPNWPRYAELLPHMTTSLALHCRDPWVRTLIINLVRYLLNAGDFAGARDVAQRGLEVWRENFGENEENTLGLARLCGVSLRRMGRINEAQELNQRTFDLLRDRLGEDHEAVLRMGDTVAADFRSQGLFHREMETQKDVFERARVILGDDDPATLEYATNLAGCLRLVGDFFEARRLDEDTLQRNAFVLGENHRTTLLTLNAVALDRRECGLYVEAARLQEDTLNRQRVILGEDHPNTIGGIRNLAVAKRKAGLHEDARNLAEECLDRYRRRYGDGSLDTVTAMMGLAADLRHGGELTKSRDLAERSFELFGEIRGKQHPFTLIAASNLAVTLRLMGRVDAAQEINKSVYQGLRENLGADHPFTLVVATNLASDLAEVGEVAEAGEMDEDTLERSERVLGARHPSTLAVALNRSLDLNQLGRSDEAAILHTKTTSSFREVLGAEHPATVSAERLVRADCDTDTMQL
ncbi:FxSxx-COOH system tetratricopeptide repeat protein [Amycolatopsis anabasis]|uniref:FxSxx-COOH system tetratricopeptide repeat protein n=1 Tax=Amycolatopsis anabasis TaxID=1840409 RepID=UPI00131E99CC|nr:FxSxx-COOH system tetratricopeptide repeat protein [Amycolatopsis anabasis]